jgi:PD-(D/E)XK endonuclease
MRCKRSRRVWRAGSKIWASVWRVTNTKATGEVSEAVVLARFLEAGFPVLLPFGDNQRYDMVVEVDGRFLRVQVKTAYQALGGCIRFNARTTNRHGQNSTHYRGQADLFAAYSPDTKQVYVLPVDGCGDTGVWLRLRPAGNNQHRHVRLAEDHTLDAWVRRASGRRAGADPSPAARSSAGLSPRTGQASRRSGT